MAFLKEISTEEGITISLYYLTGTVIKASKHTTSSGSISTDSSGNVRGGVSSTVHDDIFIIDKNGNEHSLQLSNFNVAVREGNKISIIWGVKKGEEKGSYILLANHSTNVVDKKKTVYFNFWLHKKVGCMWYVLNLIPGIIYYVLTLFLGVVGTIPIFFGLLTPLVYIGWFIFAYLRLKRKIKRINKQFETDIMQAYNEITKTL